MAAIDCNNEVKLSTIDKWDGNDLSASVVVQYRLASDPDAPGSYTTVTNTRTIAGLTFPDLKANCLAPGDYVVKAYPTGDPSKTNTFNITVSDNDLLT